MISGSQSSTGTSGSTGGNQQATGSTGPTLPTQLASSASGSASGSGSGSLPGPGSNATGGRGSGPAPGSSGTNTGSTGAPDLYYPVTVASALAKVKNLLTGLAVTDAEVSAVTADPTQLKALVAGWIQTPEYSAKMLDFFATAFQQNASAYTDFAVQTQSYDFFDGYPDGPRRNLLISNHHQMFARTVLELINEGRPFTEAYTTTRFMVTPALLGQLSVIDSSYIAGPLIGAVDELPLSFPNFRIRFETKGGPHPSSEVLDPTSPNYLTFYVTNLPNNPPGPCQADPLTYYWNNVDCGASLSCFGVNRFWGTFVDPVGFQSGFATVPVNDGGTSCPEDTFPASNKYYDYSTWRMVQFSQPDGGQKITPFFDYDTINHGTEVMLNIPRVGFYTTPSFLASWNTNDSNNFRVTVNQAMIVGIGDSFDGTDGTQPLSTASVDPTHADQPACMACHLQLDPMRQFYRQDYNLAFHQQRQAGPDGGNLVAPQFAWGGVAAQGASIADLGRLLSQQPKFASHWVQTLCQWANSAPCDDDPINPDPEFTRVAATFVSSNYNWNQLVTELFSSPLVTYLSPTQTSTRLGEEFGIARQAHLCSLLTNRLNLVDPCGLQPGSGTAYDLNNVPVIASSYPSDGFARGQVAPVLAANPTLFLRNGLENICAAVSNQVVDGPGGNYSSGSSQTAIEDFAHNLMGLSSDRSAGSITILQAHYQAALKVKGVSSTDALRSTFMLACLSPLVAGVGQ